MFSQKDIYCEKCLIKNINFNQLKISSNRIDFSKLKNLVEYPDFLDVQLQSYKDFFQLETPPEKRNLLECVILWAWVKIFPSK